MRPALSAVLFTLFAGGAMTAEDPADLDQMLAASFGGQTEDREAPAFGDADLLVPAFQGVDPRAFDRAVPFAMRRRVSHVRVAIQWGYLTPHPDATEPIDWSGSLRATNAGLRVLRRLTFEDSPLVVLPRTDVHSVEFASHTLPHADGLLLDVILAPSLNPGGGPVTLTLDTTPHSETIAISPGLRRAHVSRVDDAGHVVAYQIIRPDADGCSEGFLRGLWRSMETGDGRAIGVLKARFSADEGRLRGHLRGVFGERENGHQVLFAKMADLGGQFYAILAGRWGDGEFAGLLLGRRREVRGVVRGLYLDGDGDHDGAFIGRYSERCGEDAREGQTLDDDEPDITLGDP
jgi:hypothetical protein